LSSDGAKQSSRLSIYGEPTPDKKLVDWRVMRVVALIGLLMTACASLFAGTMGFVLTLILSAIVFVIAFIPAAIYKFGSEEAIEGKITSAKVCKIIALLMLVVMMLFLCFFVITLWHSGFTVRM
jgi:uncharacterized membrane protein YdbT with pleckstrin-like domain